MLQKRVPIIPIGQKYSKQFDKGFAKKPYFSRIISFNYGT